MGSNANGDSMVRTLKHDEISRQNANNSDSATNLAFIYERTLSQRSETGAHGGELSGTTVLECFFLFALLLEAEARSQPLQLPHQMEHVHRLMKAMNERNERVAAEGLKHWFHTCTGCLKSVVESGTGDTCELRHWQKATGC